jgi:hypothetical protein
MVVTQTAPTTLARPRTSPTGAVVVAVAKEVVATATTEVVASLAMDRTLRAHGSRATPRSNTDRYALRKVILLMNVGIASMRIMYQMVNLLGLRTTPTTSTQIGTLIPVRLTTSQAT